MAAIDPGAAAVFYATFMFLITNMLLWMFLAIVMETYATVRAETKGAPTALADLWAGTQALPARAIGMAHALQVRVAQEAAGGGSSSSSSSSSHTGMSGGGGGRGSSTRGAVELVEVDNEEEGQGGRGSRGPRADEEQGSGGSGSAGGGSGASALAPRGHLHPRKLGSVGAATSSRAPLVTLQALEDALSSAPLRSQPYVTAPQLAAALGVSLQDVTRTVERVLAGGLQATVLPATSASHYASAESEGTVLRRAGGSGGGGVGGGDVGGSGSPGDSGTWGASAAAAAGGHASPAVDGSSLTGAGDGGDGVGSGGGGHGDDGNAADVGSSGLRAGGGNDLHAYGSVRGRGRGDGAVAAATSPSGVISTSAAVGAGHMNLHTGAEVGQAVLVLEGEAVAAAAAASSTSSSIAPRGGTLRRRLSRGESAVGTLQLLTVSDAPLRGVITTRDSGISFALPESGIASDPTPPPFNPPDSRSNVAGARPLIFQPVQLSVVAEGGGQRPAGPPPPSPVAGAAAADSSGNSVAWRRGGGAEWSPF